MYKNMNKRKKSVTNSTHLYQTYTPTVIYGHCDKSKVDHQTGVSEGLNLMAFLDSGKEGPYSP